VRVHAYGELSAVSSGAAVAVRHVGTIAVGRRRVVAPVVVVGAQCRVVDRRRGIAELQGRHDPSHDVAEPHRELDAGVANDGRRRRRKQHVADDVVELATTVTRRAARQLVVVVCRHMVM